MQVERLKGTSIDTDEEYGIIFFHRKHKDEFDVGFYEILYDVENLCKERYAVINGYWPCFEPKHSKFGRMMIRSAIFYCRKYQEQLRIDSLGLNALLQVQWAK